jgi:hypothetical protein
VKRISEALLHFEIILFWDTKREIQWRLEITRLVRAASFRSVPDEDSLYHEYLSIPVRQVLVREKDFLVIMRLCSMECNAPSGYAEAFYCRKLVLYIAGDDSDDVEESAGDC